MGNKRAIYTANPHLTHNQDGDQPIPWTLLPGRENPELPAYPFSPSHRQPLIHENVELRERSPTMTANDHSLLHVLVSSPREPEAREFSFEHNEIVANAAQQAALAFGYAAGTPSFQTANKLVLDRSIGLSAAHVHDGDHLELVDVGGGV